MTPINQPTFISRKDQEDPGSDFQLWQEFRNGCEVSYALIYKNYFFILFKYGLKICPEEEIVKDCIQDLFIEIWRNRERLNNTSSIKFYLFKALKSRIINYYASSNKTVSDEVIRNLNEKESDLSLEQVLIESQASWEQKQAILSALDKLTVKQKEAIILKYYQNVENEEIASHMSISVKSLYNVISKAINILRNNIIPLLLWFVLK